VSFLVEAIYRAPGDAEQDAQIDAIVVQHGGQLNDPEEAHPYGPDAIVLTFVFDDYHAAIAAVAMLREEGFMVDGPRDNDS